MIKIDKQAIVGFESAIRGMRNPMNSWEKSDSFEVIGDRQLYFIGDNDLSLMKKLADAGPVHAKYRRMINVYADITAPLYWWKEFDTYKVGTTANSCSTMHKIHAKEFDISDFSTDHLTDLSKSVLNQTINLMNDYRTDFLNKEGEDPKTWWWQLIQLLPSSYNQKRTVCMNYEVLSAIYIYRKDHKLDEWRDFCKWIEGLPYSELITGSQF